MISKSIISVFISFFVSVIIGPFLIPYFQRLKFGQTIREDGPQSHLKKEGTPTLGWVIIFVGFIIGSIFFAKNFETRLIILSTFLFGLIGFIDDILIIIRKQNLGLKAVQKIILQFIGAIIISFLLVKFNNDYDKLLIPFSSKTLDLKILFIPFLLFIIIGTVNAVNLTDGLDGLASKITIIVSVFMIIVSMINKNVISPVIGAMIGSLMGFLIYNDYPAKIFMGDTGSLALGGFVVATAIILRIPLYLPIIGLIYVIEALSVIIQVGYFKISPIIGKYNIKNTIIFTNYWTYICDWSIICNNTSGIF